MRRTFAWLPWVLLVIVIISFIGWQKFHQPKAPVAADGVKMPAEKVEPLIDTSRSGGVVSYNAAVKVAAPAVVNIFTTQKVRQMNHPLLNDPAFREFLGTSYQTSLIASRMKTVLAQVLLYVLMDTS